MTPETFVETIENEMETELSRLGSSRALYADTSGTIDEETVLDVTATGEWHAAETFGTWASEEDGDVADAFAAVANEERRHYRSVLDDPAAPVDHEPGDEPPIQQYLRACDDTAARLGAFIGRTIAADRSKTHVAGYFVGNGNTETADVIRRMNDDLNGQLQRVMAVLDSYCGNDHDCWTRAERAAIGAIDAAYEGYTDGLEELGIDPKPIC